MKTRQDNDATRCIGVIYTKKDNEPLWSIGWGAVYD